MSISNRLLRYYGLRVGSVLRGYTLEDLKTDHQKIKGGYRCEIVAKWQPMSSSIIPSQFLYDLDVFLSHPVAISIPQKLEEEHGKYRVKFTELFGAADRSGAIHVYIGAKVVLTDRE